MVKPVKEDEKKCSKMELIKQDLKPKEQIVTHMEIH